MSKFIRFLLCLILMLSIVMTLFAAQVATASEELPVVQGTALQRGDVENRARAMANMEWTVQSWHKTVDENEYVTIHDYILEAEVGTKLRGIPYCCGGF
ncbi:MAG: hypothetical protein IIW39_01875, partial [Clostridia bacterium]|nr:hypothetical protein [Clostridia bacterium]